MLNRNSSKRLLGSQYGSQWDSQFGSQMYSQFSAYNIEVDNVHAQISQQLLGPLQLGPFAPRQDLLTVLFQASEDLTQPLPGFTQPSQEFSGIISQGFTQPIDGLSQKDAAGDDLQALQRALHVRRVSTGVDAACCQGCGL